MILLEHSSHIHSQMYIWHRIAEEVNQIRLTLQVFLDYVEPLGWIGLSPVWKCPSTSTYVFRCQPLKTEALPHSSALYRFLPDTRATFYT